MALRGLRYSQNSWLLGCERPARRLRCLGAPGLHYGRRCRRHEVRRLHDRHLVRTLAASAAATATWHAHGHQRGSLCLVLLTLFALTGFPSSWIVVGSALGSITALVGALTIDLRDILDWARGRGFGWVGAGARLQRILSDCWQICAGQVLAGGVVSVPTWAVGIFGSTDDIGRFAAAAYMITAGSLLGASLNSVLISRYHVSMTSGGVAAVQASVGRK